MKTNEILARPAKIPTPAQREFYFETGYLLLPGFISGEWLDRLLSLTAELVEASRAVTKSDAKFVLEAGHSGCLAAPASRHVPGGAPSDLLGVRLQFPCHRRRRGSARTGCQVPPLETEFQGGRRGRGGSVAPGLSVHAAHELLCPHDRRVLGGCGRLDGAHGGGARQSQGRAVSAIQRQGTMGWSHPAARPTTGRYRQGGSSAGQGRLGHRAQRARRARVDR
jgi:hypothetical protein